MCTRGRGWAAGALLGAVLGMVSSAGAGGKGWPMRRLGDRLTIQTPHYTVESDHSPGVAQLIASHQEALFRELYRRMGKVKTNPMSGRFKIKVFRGPRGYLRELGLGAMGSQGMYMHNKDLLAAWGPPEFLDVVFETLRHEGTHQFVMNFIGSDVPVWLNEGMAVFYQHSRFKGGRLELGKVPPIRVMRLQEAIKGHHTISLGRMLRMSNYEWLGAVNVGGSHAGLQYDQAWAMVHFLAFANRQKYRAPFTRFIYYLSRGRKPYRAWERTFGTNLLAFEQRWEAYVQGLKAMENLPCRDRLEVLGFLLRRYHKKRPKITGDLARLRKALLNGALGKWSFETESGIPFTGDDPKRLALLFKCPADGRRNVDISYERVPGTGGRPPTVRCKHHAGYVLETVPEDVTVGDLFPTSVVTRPCLPDAD